MTKASILQWVHWHTPKLPSDPYPPFYVGLRWRWLRFCQWMPLLTLCSPWWWTGLLSDVWHGRCQTCGCGRTYLRYHIWPAIVGSNRMGGGC